MTIFRNRSFPAFNHIIPLLLIFFGLLGCNSRPDTNQTATPEKTSVLPVPLTLRPTALPTPTNTPFPTATPQPAHTDTPIPTETTPPLPTNSSTPRPSVTPLPTLTLTAAPLPSATMPPLSTATPIPPTATLVATISAEPSPTPTATFVPSPTPTPNLSGVTVNYFRFRIPPERPSDSAILEWDVSGVSQIDIQRYGGEWGEANSKFTQPAVGEMMQTFNPAVGGWPVFYTISSPESTVFEYDFTIVLPCEYDWIFDFAYPGGTCPVQGIVSQGAQQNFEHGFMIWIAAQDIIIFSTWDGNWTGEVIDTFDASVDPINDPAINSPVGLYQPEYGFGKVWREVAGVRETLGWGVDWGADYTVKRQGAPPHRYGWSEFIRMRNNGLITLNHPNPYWVIDYPQ